MAREPLPAPSDESTATAVEAKDSPQRARPSFWQEFPVLVAAALLLALVLKAFAVQAFYIPSGSMIPTLEIGDRVLVEKLSYHFREPRPGDVVVFETNFLQDRHGGARPGSNERLWTRILDSLRELFGFPPAGSPDFIKRVVATGGDEVKGRHGHVFVNGQRLREPYLPRGARTSSFGPVTVPKSHVFVMGDNRSNSEDSRAFGAVPEDRIVGRAFAVLWPPSEVSRL